MSSEQDRAASPSADWDAVPAPPRAGRHATAIALVALAAAVTSGFWADPLFDALRLRTQSSAKHARQDVEVGRLTQTIADLERKIVDLNGTVAKAQATTAAATAAQAAAEARTGALALVQLQSALRRSGPFEAELAAVRATNANLGDLAPLIARIERHAPRGILVGAQLRQEFKGVAEEISRHEYKAMPAAWFGSLMGRQQQGVPAAVPPAGSATAVLGRAQERLSGGDLHGAVNEVGALAGEAAAMSDAWIGDARARLAADTLIERLGDRIATTLGQGPAKR